MFPGDIGLCCPTAVFNPSPRAVFGAKVAVLGKLAYLGESYPMLPSFVAWAEVGVCAGVVRVVRRFASKWPRAVLGVARSLPMFCCC